MMGLALRQGQVSLYYHWRVRCSITTKIDWQGHYWLLLSVNCYHGLLLKTRIGPRYPSSLLRSSQFAA